MINFGIIFPKFWMEKVYGQYDCGGEFEYQGDRIQSEIILMGFGPIYDNTIWWDEDSPEYLVGYHETIGIYNYFPFGLVPSFLKYWKEKNDAQREINWIDEKMLRNAY